jgi:hypothetical protein
VSAHIAPVPSLPPPPPSFLAPPPPPPPGFYGATSSGPLPPIPKPPRARVQKKAPLSKEPPTLSGFKKLKTLAVLDIDSFDIVPELQSCVRNSTATLSKLKLSFSDSLATLARKPSADPDPEDSDALDPDDEYQPTPTGSPAQNDDVSGPAKAFRALEMKKVQEAVLGRIFDIEPYPDSKPRRKPRKKEKDDEIKGKPRMKSGQDFVAFMKMATTKFMGELNGTNDFPVPQEVFDIIGIAAQRYIDEAKKLKENQEGNPSGSEASSSNSSQLPDDIAAEVAAKVSMDVAAEVPAQVSTEALAGESPQASSEVSTQPSGPAVSLFGEAATSTKAKEAQRDADPEDINIEEPEEQLSIDPEDPPAGDVLANAPTTTPLESPLSPAPGMAHARTEYGKALANLVAQKATYKALAEELESFESQATVLSKEIQRWRTKNSSVDLRSLAEAESRLLSFTRSVQDMHREISMSDSHVDYVEKTPLSEVDPNRVQAHIQQMGDYLRNTRGMALQSLSIYLVPTKASVLSRAVDLRTLRRLTLLNVGNQAPIWALLHKENKEAPLALRNIFTDNVSAIFLNFVSALEELHELFMLEREARAKPESFAPKTQTTIDHIRRMVLKKHIPTLKRLMIKNLADTAWDVNEKAVMLLCRQGKQLEELACNMSIRAMVCFLPISSSTSLANVWTQHSLMQHVAGLSSLRALHIVQLRNDDTCVWVMRETKRFLIDNVSHYPDLKLEWISIDDDDRVDRLIRVKQANGDDDDGDADADKKDGGDGGNKKKEKKEGKQKAAGGLSSSSSTSLGLDLSLDINALIAAELADAGGESSSDEEDDGFGLIGTKVETVEGMQFCDVDGIKIFKKEIVAGRL